ncbi:hypothetical protein C1752_08720 [Acaryochloris thomasi RCC1774]|uniref:Uncharacterized protein n=1 Tax=Acaryochloris thomasi RCC1774 TaxID=1764569 RepID=A0A2W1JH73_9CYAN|nr:hypothetical protein [Acaryochloris thomasi]PZD70945.1 hypothetical protein C1752_08720 [Acaryochloris thomasi RCC1774]
MAIAQDRLKAYLELIQVLLACPSGEEWILLRQNEQFVNAEFIQVMEQVATQIAADGHTQSGTFLHNLAAQLHHILVNEVTPPPPNGGPSQVYRELIQSLIDRPDEAVDLLAAHNELIGPELVHQLKQEAAQMMGQGEQETAQFLKTLAEELNRAWLEAHAFKPHSTTHKDNHNQPDNRKVKPTVANPRSKSEEPQPPVAHTEQPQGLEGVVNQLGEIATSLAQLNEHLKVQQQDPLWYMDALEKAASSDWLLSTTEVEQLIGVKPHCKADGIYQRGQWVFNKAGKIGTQTAWQVSKTSIS